MMTDPSVTWVNPTSLTEKLQATFSENYAPAWVPAWNLFPGNVPVFDDSTVYRMLSNPRIRMGLRFKKGPILSETRYVLECQVPEVQLYLENIFKQFMQVGMETALHSLEWGCCASEVLYKLDKGTGQMMFDKLVYLHKSSVIPQVLNNVVVGVNLRKTNEDKVLSSEYQYIGGMKKLWVVHNRDFHPIWGMSDLNGAHVPWEEFDGFGGAREARSIWFRKNAFDGGVIKYPNRTSNIGNGQTQHNRYIAASIMDRKRAGGTLALPAEIPTDPQWDYQPPQGSELPTTMMDYIRILKEEELEGMEIPPELLASSELGSSNNKRVLQQAFYTSLTLIAQEVLFAFCEQVAEPLVRLNFGQDIPFSLKDIKVVDDMSAMQMQNQPIDPETGLPSGDNIPDEAGGEGGKDPSMPDEASGSKKPTPPM